MALLVLLLCRELFGFASHSRGDPLITNDVLYQLSYSGTVGLPKLNSEGCEGLFNSSGLRLQARISALGFHESSVTQRVSRLTTNIYFNNS